MKVLALDFDGVIFDSSREAFTVALRTYASIEPTARLAGHRLVRETSGRLEAFGFDEDAVYRRFMDLVPLGNRAEDFGVCLEVIESDGQVTNQEQYDRAFAEHAPEWLSHFHESFYRQRRRLRTNDPSTWRSLQRPYTSFTSLLERQAGRVPLAIVTARDETSVHDLLAAYGYAALFKNGRIYDKDLGASKSAHLERLSRDLSVPLRQITFVDDKLNHLRSVEALGVRGVLAGWGHNTPREHREAERAAFPVANLANAEELLFGPADRR